MTFFKESVYTDSDMIFDFLSYSFRDVQEITGIFLAK